MQYQIDAGCQYVLNPACLELKNYQGFYISKCMVQVALMSGDLGISRVA